MYTQCPECSSAFRVTAEVLRKAGGKVRCGGCHSAFNALLYLSETRPAAPNRPAEHGQAAVPELDPVADTAHATEERETSGDAEVRDEPQSADTEDEQTWFYDTGSEWRIPGADGNRDPNAIEVALFEGHPDALPARGEIDALAALIPEHGLSYNVHLPLDLRLGSEDPADAHRSIDAVGRVVPGRGYNDWHTQQRRAQEALRYTEACLCGYDSRVG